MSVDIRSTLEAGSPYGKMDEEQSQNGKSRSTLMKSAAIQRFYPIVVGILVVLNVVLVILVAVILSRTGQLDNVLVTDTGNDVRPSQELKSPDYGLEQRIINSIKRNGELTVNVSSSLKKDVTTMLTSFYTLFGWKRSGNMFYKLVTDSKVSYETAKSRCLGNGGQLAAKVLRDPVAVKEMINRGIVKSTLTSTQFWVGLHDLNTEGDWEWIDGGKTNNVTTAWWPGEPNQSGGNEDCGNIIGGTDSKVLINDAPCARGYNYMCEVEIIPNIA